MRAPLECQTPVRPWLQPFEPAVTGSNPSLAPPRWLPRSPPQVSIVTASRSSGSHQLGEKTVEDGLTPLLKRPGTEPLFSSKRPTSYGKPLRNSPCLSIDLFLLLENSLSCTRNCFGVVQMTYLRNSRTRTASSPLSFLPLIPVKPNLKFDLIQR